MPSLMVHANEGFIYRLFSTFTTGDREATALFFSEDAVFGYPAPGALHGEYVGRAEIVRLWAEQDRCSGHRFKPQVIDVVVGDRRACLIVGIGDDTPDHWTRVVVYEIVDEQITEARIFEDDPEAAARFFSVAQAAN